MTAATSGARPGGLRSALRSKGMWLVAAVAATVVAFLLLSAPAPARVSSVDPADGVTLGAAPTAVTVIFTGELAPYDYHLTVAREGGVTVVSGPVRFDGDRLTVPVSVTDGPCLVAFHVRLRDGAELSGMTRFGVGVAVTPIGAAGADPSAGGHQHVSDDPMNMTLLVVDAVLLLALAGALLRRSARRLLRR
ncbi:copper resistance protein CopC [Dactylosporangium sp. CA-152071]|uniref:copper resistance protein CopC n=1 Tax=Dactylosporangium sp. CA-152071 TaxID=3239933 RepID=UPI003D8B1869